MWRHFFYRSLSFDLFWIEFINTNMPFKWLFVWFTRSSVYLYIILEICLVKGPYIDLHCLSFACYYIEKKLLMSFLKRILYFDYYYTPLVMWLGADMVCLWIINVIQRTKTLSSNYYVIRNQTGVAFLIFL